MPKVKPNENHILQHFDPSFISQKRMNARRCYGKWNIDKEDGPEASGYEQIVSIFLVHAFSARLKGERQRETLRLSPFGCWLWLEVQLQLELSRAR